MVNIISGGVHAGAVFAGGSMLYGAVGRPDLVKPELTEGLAHDQWHRRARARVGDQQRVGRALRLEELRRAEEVLLRGRRPRGLHDAGPEPTIPRPAE